MKRTHMPPSSSSQFTTNSDSDFVYPSADRAADSAQIMSRMISEEDIDSLMFNSVDTSNQNVSENGCQSQICLPHLQDSHSQLAAFTVAPTQPAESLASAPVADVQGHSSKEEANQPPAIYESPERETNVAPDESDRHIAKTAQPSARLDTSREQRSQSPTAPMPWQGTVKTTNSARATGAAKAMPETATTATRPANRAVKAKHQPIPHAFQDAPFQDTPFQDTAFQDTAFQRTAFQRTAFQKAKRTVEHASSAYFPEPALQPTTYQIPIRSREVTIVNDIICSFPRLVMLFLLGIGIAYMSGLAFPSVFSWLVLSSVLSGLVRGLGLVVLVSLAIAFVLEFR